MDLVREEHGYWSAIVEDAQPGTLYKYRLDGGDSYPDPASHFQPEGPHRDSEVIDSTAFPWTDQNWQGLPLKGQVIYEMHIGTFTSGGTWQSAIERLPDLAELGVTVLELMPVSEYPGQFGWGYDGVHPFAPSHLYGRPDDMRAFVDRAHALGMAVILDVVYNHLGPDGNYFAQFSQHYFTPKHQTDWGEAINFDGAHNGPVRDFFVDNAVYWIREFHLDGLRLDATQNIYDDSENHILVEITRRIRKAAGTRTTIIVSENEPQHTQLVRPIEQGGYGHDGLWNDDYHHSAIVALSNHNDAYYTDYRGRPQEFISAMKYGYLYQGQWYKWQEQRRGTSARGVPPEAFINFLQNHDQVANSARGERIDRMSSPGRLKAITALTLLGTGTPMLFQGQEFKSSAPFLYFADHVPDLARLVHEGRRKFLAQWHNLRLPEMQNTFAPPHEPDTFKVSKLDWGEKAKHQMWWNFHRDLITIRKNDPVLRSPSGGSVDGAVLSHDSFVLRWFDEKEGDRLLIVNLGRDVHWDPAPEPLVAPPIGFIWKVAFSTEDPRYGGYGTPALETSDNWYVPGEAAVLLKPERPQSERGKYRATKKNG